MEQQQKILKLKDKEIAAFKKKKNNSVGTSQKLQVANLLRICMGPEKNFFSSSLVIFVKCLEEEYSIIVLSSFLL